MGWYTTSVVVGRPNLTPGRDRSGCVLLSKGSIGLPPPVPLISLSTVTAQLQYKILLLLLQLLLLLSKGLPQQAEVARGVPGRLRPRIFLMFGSTRVVGRQPYAPAAFTPGEIPGTHFQRLSRPQGTWFCRGYYGKNSQ